MNNRAIYVFLAAALVAAGVAVAAWYQVYGELGQMRISELRPLSALLKEDQELLLALQTDLGAEKGAGILASYLAKIRADGMSKYADVRQRLDRLAENNSAIVTLINVYSPHARTAEFAAEANKFLHYAIAWRDRWNSVMELFMAGGNYPAAEVPFPKELIGAVQVEIQAAKHAL